MKIEKWLEKWSGSETGRNGTQQICEKILDNAKSELPLVYKRSNVGFAAGSRIGGKGWPDFDIVLNGRYIACECKGLTKTGYKTDLNDNQVRILDRLAKCNATVWIVHEPAHLLGALSDPARAAELHSWSIEHVAQLARKLNANKSPLGGNEI